MIKVVEDIQPESSNENREFRTLLEMSGKGAREFFLKGESYCNLALPPYITFDRLLKQLSEKSEIAEFPIYEFQKLDDVNHTIYTNKDGKFAWRPIQLINPAFYVRLVFIITEETNWNLIKKRFEEFQANNNIACLSIPIESLEEEADKKKQIEHWLEGVEKKSISLALNYDYIFKTDISEFYPSIYTHTIAWSLHTKSIAKGDRSDSLIGNNIDSHIRHMRNGQTNGIPQGSAIMDFIAEMVLGYADLELSEKIKDAGINNYKILRYRDDYRVFVNNSKNGEVILKLLTEVLLELGLKLNASKTLHSQDIIKNSIKPEKLHWICTGRNVNLDKDKDSIEGSFLRQALIIYNYSTQYPNAGTLIQILNKFFKMINKVDQIEMSGLWPLVSIITNIAYKNPRSYPVCFRILSKLIDCFESNDEKNAVVKKILYKFEALPNTGYMQIWLQRVAIKIDSEETFTEQVCKGVNNEPVELWNLGRLPKNIKNLIKFENIIDRKKLEELPAIIEEEEVVIFEY